MKNEPPPTEQPDGADPSMEEILASIRRILNDDDVAAVPAGELPGAEGELPGPPADRAAADDDVLILDQSMMVPAAEAGGPEAGGTEAAGIEAGGTEARVTEARVTEARVTGHPGADHAAAEHFAAEHAGPEHVAAEPAAAEHFAPEPPAGEPVVADLWAALRETAPAEHETAVVVHPSPVEAFERTVPTSHLVAPEAAAAAASSVDSLVRTLMAGRATQVYGGGPTLEDMVRTELRPLLKEWLDAYLPPMVERLVRVEIERVVGRVVP
jgi:cell pole-organizing protein PopZ